MAETGGRVPAATEAMEPCSALETDQGSACATQTYVAHRWPTNVLIALDRSQGTSISSVYVPSAWSELTSALHELLTGEAVLENPLISTGLMLFPGRQVDGACDAEECCAVSDAGVDVDVGPAADTVPTILDVIGATSPAGLPATAAALDRARAYFESGAGSRLDGEKYVLLVTRGTPGCNPTLECVADECITAFEGSCSADCCTGRSGRLSCVDWLQTENKVAELAESGIRTIVMGRPIYKMEASWLDAFAVAGQAIAAESEEQGRYYYDLGDVNPLPALGRAFEEFSPAKSCRVDFPELPPSVSPQPVTVAIDCSIAPQHRAVVSGEAGAAPDAGTVDNWVVDDATDPPSLQFTSEVCDRIVDGVTRIDIVVGCAVAGL